MLTRRQVLIGSAAVAAAGSAYYAYSLASKPIPGRIVGAPAQLGHRLRDRQLPPPSAERTVDVVIAGSGIAGMSAARHLDRNGMHNFVLLEASDIFGGNSACGENSVSAYPWGAHYVPLVRNDDRPLQSLFHEMGIISGFKDNLPIYNEYYLSSDPQERLMRYGRWQEGLVPLLGATSNDHAEYRRFFALIAQLKEARGDDGKPAFCIPIAGSSKDIKWRALDAITLADYLARERFTSRTLRWYVDYCCRDDYGAPADRISAWAGLHYFAARTGRAANAESTTVVTWPEGNGFFIKAWSRELGKRLEPNSLVCSVAASASGVLLDYFDATAESTVRMRARAVILALPQFVTQRILNPSAPSTAEYSPWVVANLTLSKRPQGSGMDLAWDNVAYDSAMLGYVVANHQTASRPRQETVITYYWPLCHTDPTAARREALARSHYDWQVPIVNDLYRMHPELKGHVQHIDIMVWGHGMMRPTPGSIWGAERHSAMAPIFLAHSDTSGISIFEEAFHRGTDAAQNCLYFLRQDAGRKSTAA